MAPTIAAPPLGQQWWHAGTRCQTDHRDWPHGYCCNQSLGKIRTLHALQSNPLRIHHGHKGYGGGYHRHRGYGLTQCTHDYYVNACTPHNETDATKHDRSKVFRCESRQSGLMSDSCFCREAQSFEAHAPLLPLTDKNNQCVATLHSLSFLWLLRMIGSHCL